ncbi:MAG: dihydroorotase [Elusimicrobiota bacterium]|nr:dihydroorotase [Elusimicrobiota bacterium]
MQSLLIKNGLVIDPVCGEALNDILLKGGRISRLARRIKPPPGCQVFDAAGLWVFPGFIDAHVHAREPGAEAAETLESAARAAAAGGITAALLMPNTSPALATAALVKKYRRRAAGLPAALYFSAAATAGRSGKRTSNLSALKNAGALAFTDDGSCLPRGLLAGLIKKAAALGLPLLDHPEEFSRTGRGVINAGPAARRLGLPGIPPEAELFAVLRDLLAASAAGPIHLQHLSLASSVGALRAAKKLGWPVTGETCPHYFTLSDADIKTDCADYKMKPPLRSPADRRAVLAAIADRTIDLIASDHAPHERRLKAKGFKGAPFGIIGLETLAPLCVTALVLAGRITKMRLAELVSLNPARLLGLKRKGRLRPGFDADLTLLDPRRVRRVPAEFVSKSANSPFIGMPLRGWPAATIAAGKMVFCK